MTATTLTLMMIASLLARSPDASASTPSAPAASTPVWRGLVLLLSPQVEDELTRNATLRIVGEFGAALFQVVTTPVDPSVDLMVQLETAGSERSPLAAFAIARGPDQSSNEVAVWVSNRMTRTTSVQHVRIRTENIDRAAAQLAVETVDLVRASVAGFWPLDSASPGHDRYGAAVSSTRERDGASSGPARLRLAIGAGFFRDAGTVPSSWSPEIAVSYGRPDRIEARLTLAGLGSGTDVSAGDGTGARLQRALLSLGIVRLFRADRLLQPLLSAAAGVHRLDVQGTGAPAAREHGPSAWAALLSAGGGCALVLGAHLALIAEVEALFLAPAAVVRVGQVEAGHLDRPALFAHAGFLASF
jgi:hypothetical protein